MVAMTLHMSAVGQSTGEEVKLHCTHVFVYVRTLGVGAGVVLSPDVFVATVLLMQQAAVAECFCSGQ